MNFIDIFAGCGGLAEGFEQNPNYNMIAAVEWEKPQVENLRNHLYNNYGIVDADKRVIHFDVQRTKDLINGWENDSAYGTHPGLNSLVKDETIDLIIGGPPCQAYSIAGRIRDENGMRDDYRNFLFESYMRLVRHYQPKLFVFENVPGILSAKPDGVTLVTELIRADIENAGYKILNNLRDAQFDLTQYGIPQKRKRVIIVGLRSDLYPNDQDVLKDFYENIMPLQKENLSTVRDAIGDLPKFTPLSQQIKVKGKNINHTYNFDVANHFPRFHNTRDIEIFRILAEDIESGENKYTTIEALKKLYTNKTGKTSNIHKYHVLRWDEPSNTIPAHLYKDGLRHIHPDPKQARSITVREAARLQTFPDDYHFISSAGDNYKMIGNAVPPKFSQKIATALMYLLKK